MRNADLHDPWYRKQPNKLNTSVRKVTPEEKALLETRMEAKRCKYCTAYKHSQPSLRRQYGDV